MRIPVHANHLDPPGPRGVTQCTIPPFLHTHSHAARTSFSYRLKKCKDRISLLSGEGGHTSFFAGGLTVFPSPNPQGATRGLHMEWGRNLGAIGGSPNSGGGTHTGSYGEGAGDLVYEWTSLGMATGWHRVVRQSPQRGSESWLLPNSGPPSTQITCDCGRCDPSWMGAGWTCPAQMDRDLQNEMTGFSWSQDTRTIPDRGRPNPGTNSRGAPWTSPALPQQGALRQVPHGQTLDQAPWWATPDPHYQPHPTGALRATQGGFDGELRNGAPGSSGDRAGLADQPRQPPPTIIQQRVHRRRPQQPRNNPHLSTGWGSNCGQCDLCTLIRTGRNRVTHEDNNVLEASSHSYLGRHA